MRSQQLAAPRHQGLQHALVLDRRLLAAGMPKKLAITACARKLLTILNAMARTRKPFNAALHLG
jgi:hypothetical protein